MEKDLSYIEGKIDIQIERKKALLQSEPVNKQEEAEALHKTPRDFLDYVQNAMYVKSLEEFSFSPEMVKRYVLYYFSGKLISWTVIKDEVNFSIKHDSIRRKVYGEIKAKKFLNASALWFENIIREYLNEKICSDPSCAVSPIRFLSAESKKSHCDVSLGAVLILIILLSNAN